MSFAHLYPPSPTEDNPPITSSPSLSRQKTKVLENNYTKEESTPTKNAMPLKEKNSTPPLEAKTPKNKKKLSILTGQEESKIEEIPEKLRQYPILTDAKHAPVLAYIKEVMKDQKDGYYYSKNHKIFKNNPHEIKHSIVKLNRRLFSVFPGAEEKLHIGEGGFSVVKYGLDLQRENTFVALKIVDPYKKNSKGERVCSSQRAKELTQNEAEIYQELGRLPPFPIGSIVNNPHTLYAIKTKDIPQGQAQKMVLVMNLEKGKELFQFYKSIEEKKQEKMSLSNAFTLFENMIKQVQEMHKIHVIHRDIKLENFILDEKSFAVKLLDCNLSIKTTQPFYDDSRQCGTKEYFAPEISNPTQVGYRYSHQSDIYALGCCFYFLRTCINTATAKDQDFAKRLYNLYFDTFKIAAIRRTPLDTLLTSITALKEEYHLYQPAPIFTIPRK